MKKAEIQERLAEIAIEKSALSDEEADLRAFLLKKMKVGDEDTHAGFLFRVYERENVKVDEDGLMDLIDPELLDRVTVKKIDVSKLEAAISLGLIAQDVLTQNREISHKEVLLVRKTGGK